MTWRTFGGESEHIYEALLKTRCLNEGKEPTSVELTKQARQHIYRGLGYLTSSNRISTIVDLAAMALEQSNIHGSQVEG